MSSIGDVVQRLEALIVEMGFSVSPRYPKAIPEADLPTFIIFPGRVIERDRISATELRTTRNYRLVMLVAVAPDDKTNTSQADAETATWDYIDSVPAFFDERRYLQQNDNGLQNVSTTGPMVDEGPQTTDWATVVYGAIQFGLPVTTIEDLST